MVAVVEVAVVAAVEAGVQVGVAAAAVVVSNFLLVSRF